MTTVTYLPAYASPMTLIKMSLEDASLKAQITRDSNEIQTTQTVNPAETFSAKIPDDLFLQFPELEALGQIWAAQQWEAQCNLGFSVVKTVILSGASYVTKRWPYLHRALVIGGIYYAASSFFYLWRTYNFGRALRVVEKIEMTRRSSIEAFRQNTLHDFSTIFPTDNHPLMHDQKPLGVKCVGRSSELSYGWQYLFTPTDFIHLIKQWVTDNNVTATNLEALSSQYIEGALGFSHFRYLELRQYGSRSFDHIKNIFRPHVKNFPTLKERFDKFDQVCSSNSNELQPFLKGALDLLFKQLLTFNINPVGTIGSELNKRAIISQISNFEESLFIQYLFHDNPNRCLYDFLKLPDDQLDPVTKNKLQIIFNDWEEQSFKSWTEKK